jgi:hypothetical protein
MPSPARHLPIFLRASLLVLLVLGVVIKPVLNQIGEFHAVEHALLADADGHGHDHDDDHDDEPGQDHTDGAHGLMHQASVGAAADILPTLALLPALPPDLVAPTRHAAAVPRPHPNTPFRPPIA